jgi:hypothetical protein
MGMTALALSTAALQEIAVGALIALVGTNRKVGIVRNLG